jgi:hypothetical protein
LFRQFAENGMKLLLENPQNVRDLLALTAADVVQRIDLSWLKPNGCAGWNCFPTPRLWSIM